MGNQESLSQGLRTALLIIGCLALSLKTPILPMSNGLLRGQPGTPDHTVQCLIDAREHTGIPRSTTYAFRLCLFSAESGTTFAHSNTTSYFLFRATFSVKLITDIKDFIDNIRTGDIESFSQCGIQDCIIGCLVLDSENPSADEHGALMDG